jgi:hypothetical protein
MTKRDIILVIIHAHPNVDAKVVTDHVVNEDHVDILDPKDHQGHRGQQVQLDRKDHKDRKDRKVFLVKQDRLV